MAVSSHLFNEERNNTWNTPYLFNAKELDEETDLYYYGARYYNPRTNVWLSVDPIATYNPFEKENYIDGQHNGGVYNSYNLNVYGYCYQNPVKLVDPNGKQASSLDFAQGFNCPPAAIHATKIRQETGYQGDTSWDVVRDGLYKLSPSAILISIKLKAAAIVGVEGKVSLGIVLKGKDTGPQGYASGNIGVSNDVSVSINADAEAVYPQGNPEKFRGADLEGKSTEYGLSMSKGIYSGSISTSTAKSKKAGELKGYGVGFGVGLSIKNSLPFIFGGQENNNKGFKTNSYEKDEKERK